MTSVSERLKAYSKSRARYPQLCNQTIHSMDIGTKFEAHLHTSDLEEAAELIDELVTALDAVIDMAEPRFDVELNEYDAALSALSKAKGEKT